MPKDFSGYGTFRKSCSVPLTSAYDAKADVRAPHSIIFDPRDCRVAASLVCLVDIAMFLGIEGDKPIHHQDDPSSCRCGYLIARD
jgi:hypothetical protein